MSSSGNRLRLARMLALATVLYGLVFYFVGAYLKPGYSQVTHYISELNATGTAWATELGWFGFVPIAALFAAFLVVAQPIARVTGASRLGFLLLWTQPIAFLGVALAPCDPGCSIGGSALQQIHDLLGVGTYFPAALGLFLLSYAPGLSTVGKIFFRVAAIAWLLLFLLMLMPELAPVRGLLQRIADGLLGMAVLLIAWHMLGPTPQNR
ncbi:DUF998 domain-containing protein [Arenimonas sp.]|uniref:DUF998 domain-containing protein n=1 Tax=Arenimonas sp. TaxID=1872635 RepID=UPI0039E658A8